MSEENNYQLFSAFLFSLLFLFFSPSLLYFPFLSRRQGDGVEGSSKTMNERRGREQRKEKQRKVDSHFLHSLFYFALLFSIFPLSLSPPSLSLFSLSHFPTLLWNPINHLHPFRSLDLLFLQRKSLGFLLSLAHFHYNSSEHFSANPKASPIKKEG